MARILLDAEGRLLNHAELVYGPGERALTARLLEALGCRIEDPGGPYLVALVDPKGGDFYDNCLYASEMTAEQHALEQALSSAFGGDGVLAERYRRYAARTEREPQRTTHFGIRAAAPAQLDAVLDRLASLEGELAGRVRVSRVIRPGDPGSLDPNLVQAFVRTDVCAAGLLCLGQHFELQARLGS